MYILYILYICLCVNDMNKYISYFQHFIASHFEYSENIVAIKNNGVIKKQTYDQKDLKHYFILR